MRKVFVSGSDNLTTVSLTIPFMGRLGQPTLPVAAAHNSVLLNNNPKHHLYMKKLNLSFLTLFVCMLLASCGGGGAELTGKGVFGDIPQYLLKCYEMNKQYADELEFEDNKSKQYEIEDNYQAQWAHYKNDFNIVQKLNDFGQHPVPVSGGEEFGIKDAIVKLDNHDISLASKQSMTLNLEMHPETLPSKAMCLFLDEKDSVIFSAAVFTDARQHKATASIRFNNFMAEKAQQRDYLKFSIYMLDRIRKIELATGKEADARLDGLKGNMDALIKSLHEAGVLECASLEELSSGNYTSKQSGEGEETEEADDKNKPGKTDLAYFGLRGPVKSFTEYRDETLVYKNTFTENGKWQTIDGKELGRNYSAIKRDSEKRIISFTDGEYDWQSTHNITYDEKTGWVSKLAFNDTDGSSTSITYTYDENGNVAKEVTDASYIEMGADEPTKRHDTTTYKYEETDKYGNWTKRSAKCSDDSYWTEKRIISYYK